MDLARGHGINFSSAHRPLRRARNIRVPFPNPGHGRTFYAALVFVPWPVLCFTLRMTLTLFGTGPDLYQIKESLTTITAGYSVEGNHIQRRNHCRCHIQRRNVQRKNHHSWWNHCKSHIQRRNHCRRRSAITVAGTAGQQ